MIKIFDEKNAELIWNDSILKLCNANYYQSFEYALSYKKNDEVNFIIEGKNGKELYGFVKIKNDVVKMPFGPIISSNVTIDDIMDYITEISKYYNKDVIFSASNEYIELLNCNNYLEKNWYFTTPVLDTTLDLNEIIKNCNENRRRIIKKGLINIPEQCIEWNKSYLDEFYDLYLKRMKETSGTIDFSYDYLKYNLSQINSNLVVCKKDDKVIAGHFIYHFGNTLITRYNCFDSQFASISPSARIEYELIKYSVENPMIHAYDMSGLTIGDNISEKEKNINRYKESYNPTKILSYQWYKYKK